MQKMEAFQAIFHWLIIAVLGYLVVDGLMSGSVWVRGGDKMFSTTWATKKQKSDNPFFYWLAMGFYCIGLLWLLYIAVV